MSAEIFAFIQAQPNMQPTNTITSQNETQTQPGLFEAFMNNFCTPLSDPACQPRLIDLPCPPLWIDGEISNNNFFASSVIDFLPEPEVSEKIIPEDSNLSELQDTAVELKKIFTDIKSNFDENPIEQAENFTSKEFDTINRIISQFLNDNDDNLTEKLKLLPEAKQNEIKSLIEDIKADKQDINQNVIKLAEILTENEIPETKSPEIKIQDKNNDDNEKKDDDEQKISDSSVNLAGASVVLVHTTEIRVDEKKTESTPQIMNRENTYKVEQNLDEPQKETQNFNQPREKDSPRQRVDSKKITNEPSRTQTKSQKNDFANFFDGVIDNRRHTTQTQAQLRSEINFTNQETLREGIVNVVRFIRSEGVQKANVIIDPPALGRISVELSSGTSGIEASIKVSSEQIRQLVQDQISQLRMNLSQQGVQVAEFTVDVQQDNQQHHGQNEYQSTFSEVDNNDNDENDDTEEFRIDLNEGLLYWVA